MSNPIGSHDILRTTTAECQVHNKHIPAPHMNHRHHVWPLGEGGPDTEDNIIVACPTGHYNIHDLLKQFHMYSGNVPWTVIRRYAQQERHYAELGYKRMTRKAM